MNKNQRSKYFVLVVINGLLILCLILLARQLTTLAETNWTDVLAGLESDSGGAVFTYPIGYVIAAWFMILSLTSYGADILLGLAMWAWHKLRSKKFPFKRLITLLYVLSAARAVSVLIIWLAQITSSGYDTI